ncbi:MAG: RNA methyltransferase [Gammaproteobacteria bacterium]|jgi:tRNA/rRNA methyltransferase|nr:RNA methyltransferase [Gammaproteobacteria bacterium]MBU0771576.1 RNA methyltransferase [Gammaproteobacteria bacterium]MBU0857745.1 RNA methyltransferase [Gammaproteobacteria bacterium]MBU1845308.1 RNA methyltransferase [Gammaproteobacteria bacterium]
MNPFASLDRVRVVMSHTTHPGNIGACARAMKVMGLSRLYLVNPRHFPSDEAVAMSSGAHDILDAAVLCDSLEAALAGTVAQAALTARRREMALPVREVRAAATELAQLLAGSPADVALVFGTESSGLTNEEVAMCSLPVTISTSDTYRSLNVAAAAQIMCHELRSAVASAPPSAQPAVDLAPHEGLESLYALIERLMLESGFLDRVNPGRAMPRLRRLFGRAGVESEELHLLMGALKAIGKQGPRQEGPDPLRGCAKTD